MIISSPILMNWYGMAKSLLDEDLLKFENFCMKLMHSKNELDVNFEAWLIATGEGSKVLKWKEGL